jgi:hypothetical protein
MPVTELSPKGGRRVSFAEADYALEVFFVDLPANHKKVRTFNITKEDRCRRNLSKLHANWNRHQTVNCFSWARARLAKLLA